MPMPRGAAVTSGGRFWLWWMLASIAGSGAGVLVWLLVGAALETLGAQGVALAARMGGLLPLGLGAIFGATLGTAQWLVLRRQLPQTGRWALATTCGYALVFVLGFSLIPQGQGTANELGVVNQVLLGAGLGAAAGAPSGVLQWVLVLRRQVPHAVWWAPASSGSWAVGFAASFALGALLDGLFFVAGVVGALALTGLAMAWLVRRAPGAPTQPAPQMTPG
jgi:hypothetical protein